MALVTSHMGKKELSSNECNYNMGMEDVDALDGVLLDREEGRTKDGTSPSSSGDNVSTKVWFQTMQILFVTLWYVIFLVTCIGLLAAFCYTFTSLTGRTEFLGAEDSADLGWADATSP